jgi:all-trans-retinol 13,14-reductase
MSEVEGFDVIVIGSGIGGLTVAGILAKLNQKKVLVLEQHFKIGGFTHEFARQGKFHWDVGLHYVGDLGAGSTGRAVFDYLTDGKLQWQKMPDVFEKFVYPDFTFEVNSDRLKYQADLMRMFPEEKLAIERYFQDLQRAAMWFGIYTMGELFPQWLRRSIAPTLGYFGKIARMTTQGYLERHFQDARLQALLVSQWGDYGLPPSRSCFGIHGVVASHYLNGGWYPVGGGQSIASNILPMIERAGGKAIERCQVVEILIDNGRAVGVRAQSSHDPESKVRSYYAPVVISDVGAVNTYLKLIPPSYRLPYRDEIASFPKGCSVLTLYLGLKSSPTSLGFRGENHWIYSSYNHDRACHDWLNSPAGLPPACYLSFPSLKDPQAQAHTAEIIVFGDYDRFSSWQNTSWRNRGEEYQQFKAQLTQQMIAVVDRHYPGFRDLIEYSELSTPLTVEYFDASDRGSIYGIPCIPERFEQPWIGAKTPIENLYLTGTDASSLGIMGAMMGGVKTAGLLNGGVGFFKVMSAIMRESAQRQKGENLEQVRSS